MLLRRTLPLLLTLRVLLPLLLRRIATYARLLISLLRRLARLLVEGRPFCVRIHARIVVMLGICCPAILWQFERTILELDHMSDLNEVMKVGSKSFFLRRSLG